jgi:hypothetical protein
MNEKDSNMLSKIFIAFFISVISGAGYAIFLYRDTFCGDKSCSLSTTLEKWGQTGDFFGGILNPFLTFVGLIFVIMTIKQNEKALKQNQEALKLSETELQFSREELKKSSEALQEQVKTAELQRFETTFFNLLSLFNKTVSDVFYSKELQGKNCVVSLYIKHLLPVISSKSKASTNISEISSYYGEFHTHHHGYLLDSYFCNFYNVIDFVDNSNFSDTEKRYYINLVSSQLSLHELGLLFYFCFLPIEYEYNKLSTLIKKYPILKNLDKKVLANEAHSELLEYAKD